MFVENKQIEVFEETRIEIWAYTQANVTSI